MRTPTHCDSNPVPCRFETLEGRLLLSGDVTAVFKSGNLTIQGGPEDNAIEIQNLPVPSQSPQLLHPLSLYVCLGVAGISLGNFPRCGILPML